MTDQTQKFVATRTEDKRFTDGIVLVVVKRLARCVRVVHEGWVRAEDMLELEAELCGEADVEAAFAFIYRELRRVS
jgi:MOSC domain-containing protein YiiM